MSLLIDPAGIAVGMLTEHIQKNKWPWWKMFLTPAASFFSVYAIFCPSEKGMLAGFAMALVFGMAAGCLFLLIFFLKDRFGKRR